MASRENEIRDLFYEQRFAKPALGLGYLLNYVNTNLCYEIIHSCSNFNGGLAFPSLKLGYEWLMKSHRKLVM